MFTKKISFSDLSKTAIGPKYPFEETEFVADIRKGKRPARATGSGTSRTYTLRYTIRETETRTLF
jgi:hypothetical protein